jgi:hypothetical protein
MNEQVTAIIAQRITKTEKIRQLILLGLTRTEIARLVTNGNYGFVQNVYSKMRQNGELNHAAAVTAVIEETFSPRAFDKEFGVEFEAYNVSKETLRSKLAAAGIACEIEGYTHRTTPHWKIVTDASLRGSQTFELVSPILKGEAGLQELMKVCNVLNRCGAKVNMSCGTHVHINAREFSLEQWKRVYINYARLEKAIDGFMPASRRANTNQYCKGFGNVRNFEAEINSVGSVEGFAAKLGNSRYWKVNPTSYSRHKTCEFRQHAGTTDFVKISSWIRFLSNLVDYSETSTVRKGATLEAIKAFNPIEIVNFFEYRTLELAA